jgi:hypothetical protein
MVELDFNSLDKHDQKTKVCGYNNGLYWDSLKVFTRDHIGWDDSLKLINFSAISVLFYEFWNKDPEKLV